MSLPVKINFKMYQGSTFLETLRWESAFKVYVPIANISKSAPVVITAPNHQALPGWRIKVVGAGGMKEINTLDYSTVSAKTVDTVTLNEINALNYTSYTSGGVLEYNKPVDLTGYTARMQIRDRTLNGPVLLNLTSENNGIILDTELQTITIEATAAQTAPLNFKSAVYSLELEKDSTVVPFCSGSITLVPEVTR